MRIRGFFLGLALAVAASSVANAQCSGSFAVGNFCGNSTASLGIAKSNTPTAMFDRAFCGTNNSMIARVGGTWGCVGPVTVPLGGTGATTLSGIIQGNGTSPFTALSGSGVLDLIGTTRGSILYRGASGWAILAPGTATHVLTSNGAGADPSYVAAGTGTVTAGGDGIVPTSGSPATLYMEQGVPGGRISLGTASSVGCSLASDQTGHTKIYYSPCVGHYVPVYDGTNMRMKRFTSGDTDTNGLVIDMASSAVWTTNFLYDIFVGLDSGTLRLCAIKWSATAAGTSSRATALSTFKGLLVASGTPACQYTSGGATFNCVSGGCTYLGTVLLGASNGTIDYKLGGIAAGCSQAVISIYNQYNQAPFKTFIATTTASWTYSTATFRPPNNVAACSANVVVGQTSNAYSALYQDRVITAASGAFTIIGRL